MLECSKGNSSELNEKRGEPTKKSKKQIMMLHQSAYIDTFYL
jgi:hypothetical protein